MSETYDTETSDGAMIELRTSSKVFGVRTVQLTIRVFGREWTTREWYV